MLDISDDVIVRVINGSVQRGGWQCRFTTLSDTDLVTRGQQINVKWRGGFGTCPGVERAAFKGYVMPARFQFDRTGSQAEFNSETSDGFLRRGWCQGIGFADLNAVARAHYHQFDSVTGGGERMTCGRLVRHILGYYDTLGVPPATNPDWVAHTNMVFHATQNPHGWITLDNVETTPFDAIGAPDGTMRTNRYIVRETDNLWTRLREIARNEFFEIWFDKNDNLYYAKHPMYQAVLPNPVMTFDEDFCVTPPIVEMRDVERIRQVRLHAVTDEGNTLHSDYPASPTHVYGNTIEMSRVRCNDQNALDDWAMRYYYWVNRPWTVRWTVAGLAGLLFEILDRVEITYIGTSANGVHVNWNQEKFWIHEINVVPDEGFGGRSTFLLEAENLP